MLGLPFGGADPAIAVAGAAVFETEGVQHAVADEPVRARRLELRVGAVAIERAVELARQLAGHLQKRRVALKRDRRQIGPRRIGCHLVKHLSSLRLYLYIVKMASYKDSHGKIIQRKQSEPSGDGASPQTGEGCSRKARRPAAQIVRRYPLSPW